MKVIESFPEPVVKEATCALATKVLFPSPRSKEESDPSKTLTISFPDPEKTWLLVEEISIVLFPDPASIQSAPDSLVILSSPAPASTMSSPEPVLIVSSPLPA